MLMLYKTKKAFTTGQKPYISCKDTVTGAYLLTTEQRSITSQMPLNISSISPMPCTL